MKEIIYPHAIRNAAAHGKADAKAVLSKVLAERPDLRKNAKDVLKEVENVVTEVNTLSMAEIQREAEQLRDRSGKREGKKGLADLPCAEAGKLILRFAPNPSGPLHIGHARAAVLNDEYVKRYEGKLLLRFEDTDPRRVDPDAYEFIREDLKWLDVEWDEEILQSQRLETYYSYARELISKEAAYVCTCPQEDFKKLRESGHPCPCRTVGASLDEFNRMFDEYSEGEVGLRLKTDLRHKNVSIRDFPIMRIVEEPHPLAGDKRVYPLMNLSVAIDDHELGLTHVLRGKDHILNTLKQGYIFDYLGWPKPVYVHYGLLKILHTVLSTSDMKKNIGEGVYSGWDDVRLGTLAALRRRGIKPGAIRRAMLDVGIKPTDITFSWKNLYAYNKDLIDAGADRYSFVDAGFQSDPDGVEKPLPFLLRVANCPEFTAKNRLHPTEDRGERTVKLGAGTQEFLLRKEDFSKLKEGETVRLMGAYNVRIVSKIDGENGIDAEFQSLSLEDARGSKAKLINWVNADDNITVKVISSDKPEGQIGFAEKALENTNDGEIVQFERYGFVRLERDVKGRITAVFAHK